MEKVQLNPDKLILEGRRVGISFHDDQRDPIELTTGKSHDPERIHIEIAGTADYEPALHAIFADSLAELTPTLPDFWQRYALAHFPAQPSPDPAPKPRSQVARVGGAVKAPRLIHSVEPTFSEAARQLRINGNVLVHLVVNEEGKVDSVDIVRPTGLGLDEQAVAAVRKYTFSPATRDDQSIPVEINVSVNFQIF